MKNHEEVPLKGFLQCDECGGKMTAYKASKNQKYYYKCNKKGCKNNQRAEEVHESFKELLSYFQVDKKHIKPLKLRINDMFSKMNEEAELKKKTIKFELQSINTKLEKLEEKFIFDSITEPIYKKHLEKLTVDKNVLLKDLENPLIKLSNLNKYVNFVTKISSNLLSMWNKEIHEEQVKIQSFLFPEGIRYNREKGNYRTLRVNTFLSLNNSFSNEYLAKKNKAENLF